MISIMLLAILPVWEMRVVDRVAERYALTHEQKHLLVSIRRAENGTRLFYGIADPRCVGYEKQCGWAANTIRLRYDGDLWKFARRWCPENYVIWFKNVNWFMRKQKEMK